MGHNGQDDHVGLLREMAENVEVTLHLDYSGRGMYGRECIGVSGTETQLWHFALTLGLEMMEIFEDPPHRDNLGFDTIWYWPAITVSTMEAWDK